MLNEDIRRRTNFADSAEHSYEKFRIPPSTGSIKADPWDPFFGYYCSVLRDLNANQINWNAECGHCTRCSFAGAVPTAGSYASTLRHFEHVMGALSGKRENVRCMVIFQDPRKSEPNFVASHPHKDPALLASTKTRSEMRYFGMNVSAWRSLRLNEFIGCEDPCWPSGENAHHYLRRYFRNLKGEWSYEGLVAYFLHLFRPAAAYITNLAKCHFGENQNGKVFRTCKLTHLSEEFRAFSPNLVLSFTREMKNLEGLPTQPDTAFLSLLHPARNPTVKKRRRFEDATEDAAADLAALGYKPANILDQWNRDCDRVARS